MQTPSDKLFNNIDRFDLSNIQRDYGILTKKELVKKIKKIESEMQEETSTNLAREHWDLNKYLYLLEKPRY